MNHWCPLWKPLQSNFERLHGPSHFESRKEFSLLVLTFIAIMIGLLLRKMLKWRNRSHLFSTTNIEMRSKWGAHQQRITRAPVHENKIQLEREIEEKIRELAQRLDRQEGESTRKHDELAQKIIEVGNNRLIPESNQQAMRAEFLLRSRVRRDWFKNKPFQNDAQERDRGKNRRILWRWTRRRKKRREHSEKFFIGEGDVRPKQQQHQVGSHRHQNNPQYSWNNNTIKYASKNDPITTIHSPQMNAETSDIIAGELGSNRTIYQLRDVVWNVRWVRWLEAAKCSMVYKIHYIWYLTISFQAKD